MTDDHTAWSRNLWESIAEGGTWAVPRSGLIFNRRDGKLVLTSRIPHDPAMPMDADELNDYHLSEFTLIKSEFAKIGVEVEDATSIPVAKRPT